MKVTLIRHTKVNVPKGTCYGWSDVPVADSFCEEATITKANLSKKPPFDAVFSSPLTRARKLASYCGYDNPTLDDRLKEMNMGDWEMRLYDDIAKEDPHILAWYEDYMHLEATGGESFPMLFKRVSSFLDWLKQQPFEHVGIFAHGGVLICAGIYGGLFPKENAFENLTAFGGIEEIEL
ncbi:alpha-ribazole phosphatase family protein [Prevotella salivae]|jgi:alpha-ribazole phosphatase|uniref:alpha-ribazole phosphatase family protein n=1 Tax=Segatella salivae TaxID=228604 RepID=UPI001C5CE244|nr:alpha-ribazole phosphatase family protein [Segatella salivae]MBW4907790.1 alpha-ribazole phosphatase family protein [Segatella salivae]